MVITILVRNTPYSNFSGTKNTWTHVAIKINGKNCIIKRTTINFKSQYGRKTYMIVFKFFFFSHWNIVNLIPSVYILRCKIPYVMILFGFWQWLIQYFDYLYCYLVYNWSNESMLRKLLLRRNMLSCILPA